MARPTGSRNRDYEQTRDALARKLVRHLVDDGEPASLSTLAAAADVSVATLRHYFGSREGVARAAMEVGHRDARAMLDAAADPGELSAEAAIVRHVLQLVEAFRRFGVGEVFVGGLVHGLTAPPLGPSFVDHVLEPVLQTCERLIAALCARGDLAVDDPREGALALVSPVVLALLHQDALSGQRCRPLDVEGFARRHALGIARSWRPPIK